MSKGGGGGGTNTIQSSEPPKYLQPYLKSAMSDARKLYRQGAPDYYPGQTYANLDPLQQEALNKTVNLARSGSPLMNNTENFVNNTLTSQSGQNPYLDQIVGKAAADANAMINSQFNKSGRLGSGANAETAGRAITAAQLPYLFNQYNADQQMKLQAAGMAPVLAESKFNDINRIASAGDVNQQEAQKKIDDLISRYNYTTGGQGQEQNLDKYLSRLFGQAQIGGTSSTSSTKQGGGIGQTLGGIASLGSMFAPGGLFGSAASGLGFGAPALGTAALANSLGGAGALGDLAFNAFLAL